MKHTVLFQVPDEMQKQLASIETTFKLKRQGTNKNLK
jgi:hypothetical protein